MLGKFPRWKYIFRLMCGITLILIYYINRLHRPTTLLGADYSISFLPATLKKATNVSAVSTGSNVPLIIVGLYHLPSNESKSNRHRALKEHAYGTMGSFNYPIGAQLYSNASEYAIGSDRIFYRTKSHGLKYFSEVPYHVHLDIRYGKPENIRLSNTERASILRGLLSAWSNFTDEKQIPYWLAHGSLLGWWWGGTFLPWDTDIDVQMNSNFLYVLSRFSNTVVSNRYLVDVNPHFRARQIQIDNYIDARLIDMQTGYFIDITGMADTEPITPSDPQKLLLRDKHQHIALYSDLHPLVRIELEGIATWRPYRVENCLIREYGAKALAQTTYRGYNYDETQARWVGNGPLLPDAPPVSNIGRQTASPAKIRARPGPTQNRVKRAKPKHGV